jgi:hypothetical protein
MTEDRLEFVAGVALLAFVLFALTPSFWGMIAFLGK